MSVERYHGSLRCKPPQEYVLASNYDSALAVLRGCADALVACTADGALMHNGFTGQQYDALELAIAAFVSARKLLGEEEGE